MPVANGLQMAYLAATAGVSLSARQIATTSTNIMNSSRELGARQYSVVSTRTEMSSPKLTTFRATSDLLYLSYLRAQGDAAAVSTKLSYADAVANAIGAPDEAGSVSMHLSELQAAIGQFSLDPQNHATANATVKAAGDLAERISLAGASLTELRSRARAELADHLETVNQALNEYTELQARRQTELSDHDAIAIDDRLDEVVASISKLMHVDIQKHSDATTSLFTLDGLPLSENGHAAKLMLSASPEDGEALAVEVDGIKARPAVEASGDIYAIMTIANIDIPEAVAKLDKFATKLVDVFAEDGPDGSLSPLPGLLSFGGAELAGRAVDLTLNPLYDYRSGGDPLRLRDGGADGLDPSAYSYNLDNVTGFDQRLVQLGARLTENGTSSIAETPSAMATALAADVLSNAAQLGERASALDASIAASLGTLRDAIGIDMDQELSIMLGLENSYQASARMLSVVDGLFDQLLEAVQ